MQIRSTSPIYKCWNSAVSSGNFSGGVQDFILAVGHHPGSGYAIRRIDTKKPFSKDNFLWIKTTLINTEQYVKEGEAAKSGDKCPYSTESLMERCAWLAGHYDQHGKIAWEMARV